MSFSRSLSRVIKDTCSGLAQNSWVKSSWVQSSSDLASNLGKRVITNIPSLNNLTTSEIPLASVDDNSIVRLENIDWRDFFSKKLSGLGLEIGPLHRPMVTHKDMNVHYVDRCSVEDLRKHYPELNELPLVEPHILDDAETLSTVSDETYDFLIAAHVIEHMKNPLASLEQWARVLKPGGLIYMIVPDKRRTFDKQRVRTTVAHIVNDYLSPSNERDFEHYLDYAIHVHSQTNPDNAISEARRLIETDYSIHFHVFMPEDVLGLIRWFGEHVRPLEILEGPHMSPCSDEFHFLLSVSKSH
ncbi:MAG TPA: class I SAM-dependent methyltransferase [Oligoflexia bacterium]|nr:class I SAM-dependent methyltransferase [Oligoflexia bacterium]HMP47181.1 class I SAM-dependent methyltransferase [Oligoflexia bacterium]